MSAISSHASLLSDEDLYLFNEGRHFRIAERLGARPASDGSRFGVWAPAAAGVSVIGDFNGWDPGANQFSVRGNSGIWEVRTCALTGGRPGFWHGRPSSLLVTLPPLAAVFFAPAGPAPAAPDPTGHSIASTSEGLQ